MIRPMITGDLDLEPCPHCEGTGWRLIPPPPARQGNNGRKGKGRRCGYEATYAAGCRCDLCRAAHREGTARRKRRTTATQ